MMHPTTYQRHLWKKKHKHNINIQQQEYTQKHKHKNKQENLTDEMQTNKMLRKA